MIGTHASNALIGEAGEVPVEVDPEDFEAIACSTAVLPVETLAFMIPTLRLGVEYICVGIAEFDSSTNGPTWTRSADLDPAASTMNGDALLSDTGFAAD
jgi:hypothetical protein